MKVNYIRFYQNGTSGGGVTGNFTATIPLGKNAGKPSFSASVGYQGRRSPDYASLNTSAPQPMSNQNWGVSVGGQWDGNSGRWGTNLNGYYANQTFDPSTGSTTNFAPNLSLGIQGVKKSLALLASGGFNYGWGQQQMMPNISLGGTDMQYSENESAGQQSTQALPQEEYQESGGGGVDFDALKNQLLAQKK